MSMTETNARSYAHTRDDGQDNCTCGGEACADCLECLDDPDHHCPQCGDHVDGLGECQNGCPS